MQFKVIFKIQNQKDEENATTNELIIFPTNITKDLMFKLKKYYHTNISSYEDGELFISP